MDTGIKQELQRAYAYLKSGDRKSASQILVAVLKQDSEIEQAWLMLSLAVDDPRRQEYALEQVLRLNPDNDKARERLTRMTGKAPPRPSAPAPAAVISSAAGDESAPFTTSEDDLLTSRLFGEPAAASAGGFRSDAPEVEDTPYAYGADDRPFEEEPTVMGGRPKKPRPEGKPGGRRWVLPVLLILLVLVVGGGYLVLSRGVLGGLAAIPAGEEQPSATATDAPAATEEPTPTFTPTTVPSPTPVPTATVAPLPSPTALGQLLPSGGAQIIATVETQVRTVRGITATPELERGLVSTGVLQEVLRSQTGRDSFMLNVQNEGVAVTALGLAFPGVNLQTYYQNSQILPFAGLYVPEALHVYMVGLGIETRHQYYYAHLYDLALLDAEFDLGGLGLTPDCTLGFDRCRALNALVQGDAVLTRQQWATRFLTAVQARDVLNADAPPPFLSDLNPPLFVEPDLAFPYERGLAFVEAIHRAGGWAAVNAVYLDPPVSTEQILHPDRYLEGDLPLVVVDPLLGEALPGAWRLVKQDTLGEWGTYLMLGYNMNLDAAVELDAAATAAEGWGGDEFQVYQHSGSRQTALKAHWIFDTFDDAEEFDAALALSLSGWFPGVPAEEINEICYGGGPIACTVFLDNEVFLFILPDATLMNAVLELYAFGR